MSTEEASAPAASSDSPAASGSAEGTASSAGSANAVARRHMQRSGRRRHHRSQAVHYIKLKPSNAIKLQLATPDAPRKFTAKLTISNPSEYRVMFKIRTTSQNRFKVKPWFGILDAVSVVDVQISVIAPQSDELYKLLASGDVPEEKFRVQSAKMDSNTLAQLTGTQDQRVIISRFWKEAQNRDQVASDTLPVAMPTIAAADTGVDEDTGTGDVSAAAPAPATASTSAAATEGATATAGGSAAAAVPPQVVPAGKPRGDVAAAAAAVAGGSGDGQEPLTPEELERLRAHYNDLLRFTFNESAQHDQELTQREMELEALNKRLEEAQGRIRELEAAGAGTRRRRGDGGAAESKANGDATDGGSGATAATTPVKIVRSGFPLWQVLLISVVMFVLGALWTAATTGDAEEVEG